MTSAARKPKKIANKKKLVEENPDWRPTKNPVKITGSKTSTEVLMEMRAEERY